MSRLRGLLVPALSAWCCACASIETGRYGLSSLSVSGNHALAEEAVTECLISRERDTFGITIGLSQPTCGVPPFDTSPARIALWRWPWTEWPTFNRAIFDQDLERVLRFYRARGFYDAKVVRVTYAPEHANEAGLGGYCKAEDCRLDVLVHVDEGAPVLVRTLDITGLESLPARAQQEAREAVLLRLGEPMDETLHDQSKAAIVETLRALGWAGVQVEARIEIEPREDRAAVHYRALPGPWYRFGELTLQGQGELPRDVIEKAAGLDEGAAFDPDVLREIQAEVFALGAFSSVEVKERLDPSRGRADVEVLVTPLPLDALRVGAGVLSGTTRRTETDELRSIPQWDVHLFARYQRRHVLGSLGQITLEDRPRLIFNKAFPSLEAPRPGNVLSLGASQPGLFEARTHAFARTVWDYGPDAYLGFFRSDLLLRVGATRGFGSRRLVATLAVQQDIFSVIDEPAPQAEPDPSDGATTPDAALPSSYRYAFLEQDLRLDLRDIRTRPRSGVYVAVNATEALRGPTSDWSALRVAPEVRAYVPLPLDMVLAQRLALASLFVANASSDLDETSRELGPTNYRLRGGGASSNRGFLAGTLGEGAGLDGGTRRWEASLELRIPIGQHFVVAGFADAGDVNRAPSYRFSHLNTTLGYGIRYHTVIGAIRLDVGHRIAAWQRADGGPGIESDASTLFFSDAPGAAHLTIGDPF